MYNNAGSVDINCEAVSALSSVCRFNDNVMNTSSLQSVSNDRALDDKSQKCSVSNHYHHNDRRRSVAFRVAANDKQCN